MTDLAYIGNSIPAPGFRKGRRVVDDEILYSSKNYTQKGVTLKPGQGVLLGGTLLTQDAATKQYVKATSAADALGILRKTTDTGNDPEGQVWLGNIVYEGIVKLAAVQAANSGVSLTNVLNGRVDEVEGFFKF